LVIHGPVDETKKCSFSAKQNEMEAVCVQGVGDAARRLKVVLLSNKTLNVNEDKEYWYVFFFIIGAAMYYSWQFGLSSAPGRG
jgi:hypothetical protein